MIDLLSRSQLAASAWVDRNRAPKNKSIDIVFSKIYLYPIKFGASVFDLFSPSNGGSHFPSLGKPKSRLEWAAATPIFQNQAETYSQTVKLSAP